MIVLRCTIRHRFRSIFLSTDRFLTQRRKRETNYLSVYSVERKLFQRYDALANLPFARSNSHVFPSLPIVDIPYRRNTIVSNQPTFDSRFRAVVVILEEAKKRKHFACVSTRTIVYMPDHITNVFERFAKG